MEVFEQIIRYDQQNVGRAARALFSKIWAPFLPVVLPAACVVLAIVAVVSIFFPVLRYIGIMWAALVALTLSWWPFAYRRFYRRLMTHWRGEGLLKLGPDGIYVHLNEGEVATSGNPNFSLDGDTAAIHSHPNWSLRFPGPEDGAIPLRYGIPNYGVSPAGIG